MKREGDGEENNKRPDEGLLLRQIKIMTRPLPLGYLRRF